MRACDLIVRVLGSQTWSSQVTSARHAESIVEHHGLERAPAPSIP